MSHPHSTVFELVRLAQDGNRQALNRLFVRYYGRVMQIVRLRLGPRLRQSMETADLMQDTFLAAIQSFQRFEMRDEASFIHWLSKLAEYQVTRALTFHSAQRRDTSRQRSLRMPSIGNTTTGIDLPAGADTPCAQAEAREEREWLEDCIRELPTLLREIVILRNYNGCSWRSVAEKTERPSQDAARMMHARAMIELGRLLRRKGRPRSA